MLRRAQAHIAVALRADPQRASRQCSRDYERPRDLNVFALDSRDQPRRDRHDLAMKTLGVSELTTDFVDGDCKR